MSKKENRKGYEKIKQEEWIEMVDMGQPKSSDLFPQKVEIEEDINVEKSKINYPSLDVQPERNLKEKNFNKKQQIPARGQQKKPKRPSIPMIQVTCEFCTVSQYVPGNAQVYSCGSCENLNQCEPLYGVFICGCCQTKVCFGFGLSIMVKCPKCKSINKVPAQSTKNYQSLPKPPPFTQKRQQQRARQVIPPEHEDFFQYPGVQ